MDAPDELRQAIGKALWDNDLADDSWDVEQLEAGYLVMADAVLAVPAIADALRAAELLAKVREIMDERITGFAGSDDAVHEIAELLESATP